MPRKKAEAAPASPHLDVMAEINKMFPGAMTVASDDDLVVKRWPTGMLPLDLALDGGVPRGRYLEFYGPYSTLKSYALYKALAAVQQAGGKVALIDTEHSWDPEWGESLGIDPTQMFVGRPETAEQCITILQALIKQRYDLVGWDSIAATFPKQYAEAMPGSGSDEGPAALARVMSRGLARITAHNKHTSVIFINQTRAKIGVTFGSKTTTSGGQAMGFYASYRLSFTRIGKVTETVKKWDGSAMVDAKKVIAHKVLLTLEKSKLSAPQTEVYFLYDLATGEIDTVDFLTAQGIEAGLITRNGTGHHHIPDVLDKAIHGAGAFREWLRENEDVQEWLTAEILPASVLACPTQG